MKFLIYRVYLQRSHPNFQKDFVSPKMTAILNFRIFWQKHKNAYILKTVLDRADYANFGCHNSIRLEAKHFLNTLALTFISFSGCFVFAVQKDYLFFASDPLVMWGWTYYFCFFRRPPSGCLVSAHLKEKYLSCLYQIWYGCLLGE